MSKKLICYVIIFNFQYIFFFNTILIYPTLFDKNIVLSDNFIHHDIFLEHSNFIFDPTISLANSALSSTPKTFDPKKVKFGDIIAIRCPEIFFKQVHPQIKVPYIVLTLGHWSDAFMENHLKFLNKQILAWFAIHLKVKPNNKLFNIPLGINQRAKFAQQRHFYNNLFKQLRIKPKNKWLYFNCKIIVNPIRQKIKDHFSDKSYCYISNPSLKFEEYLKEMSEFKFTLCPPGASPDTYRTWEALMVGSVPIVESSYLDNLYKNLPIVVIKNWQDITLSFLKLKYKEIKAKKSSFKFQKLYVEYWLNKINKIKKLSLSNFK